MAKHLSGQPETGQKLHLINIERGNSSFASYVITDAVKEASHFASDRGGEATGIFLHQPFDIVVGIRRRLFAHNPHIQPLLEAITFQPLKPAFYRLGVF